MPYHDGVHIRQAPHLTWRPSDPTRDVDDLGHAVPEGYTSFVRVKDCGVSTDAHGRPRRDPSEAPAIPVAHGGTTYGYGRWREWHSRHLIGGRPYDVWWSCTLYVVRDGRVSTGVIVRGDRPEGGDGHPAGAARAAFGR